MAVQKPQPNGARDGGIADGAASALPPAASSTAHTNTPPAPHRLSYFPLSSLDHFAAGLIAGSVSTLTLHPFDLIKTRLQVAGFEHGGAGGSATHATGSVTATAGAPVAPVPTYRIYRSSIHAARSLIKHEGAAALYKGLSPNLVGNTVAWGLYFFGYDVVKRWFSSHPPLAPVKWVSHPAELKAERRPLNALEHILAASITGTAVSALTNPLWVVKTRMFLDHSPPPSTEALKKLPPEARAKLGGPHPVYKGLTDALRSIWRTEGFSGLYRGFVPGLFGVSHGAVQFMCYEELKKARLTYKLKHSTSSLDTQSVVWSTPETIAMSIASKSFAACTTYPYQVLRSRMQSSPTPVTVRAVAAAAWKAEGIAGFYRGLYVNLVKVMPAACTVFVVYEQVSGYMKRHATYPQN
jgi:solute carrier family 25 folate transporter 32